MRKAKKSGMAYDVSTEGPFRLHLDDPEEREVTERWDEDEPAEKGDRVKETLPTRHDFRFLDPVGKEPATTFDD